WRSSTPVWSYPNLHGDLALTTDTTGTKQGPTRVWDPWGKPLTITAEQDNSTGQLDYGWHGAAQRPLEHQTGVIPTIEMGARQYDPTLARFLEIDPVEGGTANDYAYVNDPINKADPDGRCFVVSGHRLPCSGKHPYTPKGQKGSRGPGKAVPAPGGGYVDNRGRIWKWNKPVSGQPRGHWDVTDRKGRHINVGEDGEIDHGGDKPKRVATEEDSGSSIWKWVGVTAVVIAVGACVVGTLGACAAGAGGASAALAGGS
ncbi:MAG: hypothetical protein IT195_11735, partial [Microthrixaceae bacterium]|nr:hypothetical protein [Microthrixaceae bacterium]